MKRLQTWIMILVAVVMCVLLVVNKPTVQAQNSPNTIVISQDQTTRTITVQLCNPQGCTFLAFTNQPTTVADVVVNKLYSGL